LIIFILEKPITWSLLSFDVTSLAVSNMYLVLILQLQLQLVSHLQYCLIVLCAIALNFLLKYSYILEKYNEVD